MSPAVAAPITHPLVHPSTPPSLPLHLWLSHSTNVVTCLPPARPCRAACSCQQAASSPTGSQTRSPWPKLVIDVRGSASRSSQALPPTGTAAQESRGRGPGGRMLPVHRPVHPLLPHAARSLAPSMHGRPGHLCWGHSHSGLQRPHLTSACAGSFPGVHEPAWGGCRHPGLRVCRGARLWAGFPFAAVRSIGTDLLFTRRAEGLVGCWHESVTDSVNTHQGSTPRATWAKHLWSKWWCPRRRKSCRPKPCPCSCGDSTAGSNTPPRPREREGPPPGVGASGRWAAPTCFLTGDGSEWFSATCPRGAASRAHGTCVLLVAQWVLPVSVQLRVISPHPQVTRSPGTPRRGCDLGRGGDPF